MIASALTGLSAFWENLNDRERKLVGLLGILLGLFVVVGPLYLVTSSVSAIEDENREIRDALRDIARSRGEIAEQMARREARDQLYERPAPPLGSFLESKAREAGYERPLELTDQPEKVSGGFTRRHVRASLPNVGLRTTLELVTAIKNSNHPVAVEQLNIDHFQAGDRYNVQLGVQAFDRSSARSRRRGGGDDEDGDTE